ncbi:MAG: hypothetical protein F6K10_42395 [Moorea sp. SIO2B7]|nr:hypothetical protein [Moorena sp. SIO2B7]
MSKFEELCQIYANSRQEYFNCKNLCQDFADFVVKALVQLQTYYHYLSRLDIRRKSASGLAQGGF